MERYNMSPFGFPFLFKEFFKILRYKLIYGTQEIKQMNKGGKKKREWETDQETDSVPRGERDKIGGENNGWNRW